ncbi:MAG: MBL fold metallo-hydrolase [Chloroflexi bacterium]|nr:MBL fold metallo-hydrolase [Chloroflexota bacterium]
MEIAPGIHSIPSVEKRHPGLFPPNVYLLLGPEPVLIDSGEGKEKIVGPRVKYLQDMGVKPRYILITHGHPDHWGGAVKIREVSGAKILAHRSEKKPPEGTQPIDDGFKLELGKWTIQAIHTPGHTPGSICYWAPQLGALFTGDSILGIGTTVIRPKEGDMGRYVESLKKLLPLPLKVVYPGHGPAVNSPLPKIEELIRHRQEREVQVIGCLKKGVDKPDELVACIYPEVSGRIKKMALEQVMAQLAKLQREGAVVRKGRKKEEIRYVLIPQD